MAENATATFSDTQISPGVYQYTITLTDTGTTTIGTFWFAWDDQPDQDFMSQEPTNIGAPAGWTSDVTTEVYPGGTGYGIDWVGADNPISQGGTSSAFTFTSTETPAQMAAVSPVDNSFQTTSSIVYLGTVAPPPNGATIVVTPATPPTGLIGNLNINQQLELIYIAYFNRAADGGGNSFWVGQNTQAQAAGQTAAIALTNIANSFTPQAETIALYPFLGTPNLNLNTTGAQAGLNTFIDSVYSNLFARAADAAGQAYWVAQITNGAVGLGAAALAIANGATGSDAIEVQNKITVALDFTTRTTSAGLGQTGPLPAAFLTAARSALSGVDGSSLNDASVTAGEAVTSAYITNPASGQSVALGMMAPKTMPLTISVSNSVVDPGIGNANIQFISGVSSDTLALHLNSLDQISGFNPSTDVLDLRSLLSEANVDLSGRFAALGDYITVVDRGQDALMLFDATGHGGGSTVADLQGLGGSVTSLASLIAHGAIQIA